MRTLWAISMPMSRAMYSATLLVHGSDSENARGSTYFWAYMSTTPTPAIRSSFELVRVRHQNRVGKPGRQRLPVVNTLWLRMGILFTFSRLSMLGCRKDKLQTPILWSPFWGRNSMSYHDWRIAHSAKRPFRADGFIMRNCQGLTLDLTWIVWPTK